jgi:uncharacterized RDD family membrane protein YckC
MSKNIYTQLGTQYNYSTWRRITARLLDQIVVIIVISILAIPLGLVFFYRLPNDFIYIILYLISGIVFQLLYHALCVKYLRQTLGQKMVGLQYEMQDGSIPSFKIMFLRSLCSLIPLSQEISVFTCANSPEKKSIFDSIMGTTVVVYRETSNLFVKCGAILLVFSFGVSAFLSYADTSFGTPKTTFKNSNSSYQGPRLQTFPETTTPTVDVQFEKLNNSTILIKRIATEDNIINVTRQLYKTSDYGDYSIYDESSNIREYYDGKVSTISKKGDLGKIYFETGSKPRFIIESGIFKME